MDEKMHFMTEPEELLNWMKEHEEFKVMNEGLWKQFSWKAFEVSP